MDQFSYQDMLIGMQQPSQYLGNEINAVVKDHRRVKLSVALVFPDLYEIGTSHFGMQILYNMLNRHPDIVAERVFAPGLDLERYLRDQKMPMVSLETRTPLNQFDIIGVSLLYELNYTNMLNILDLGKIPLLSGERGPKDPVVIAGGPCTCNPEPVAVFFDAMVIGDGEAVVDDMMAIALAAGNVRSEKTAILDEWSHLQGVYLPSRYSVSVEAGGHQRLTPIGASPARVRRATISDLNRAPFPDKPVLPYGRPVHDRLRLELARGCTRGCRFCQAGMIYRPVRERSVQNLVDLSNQSLAATGYEDISLLSLSTGDYSGITPLMDRLMARCEADRIALSLPSLRVGTLTPPLMKLIQKVRKTGFTLAPEAGSQRLRDVINKNITEDDLRQTVAEAFGLGWQLIKLYFMIGLPTETPEDHQALVDLVASLQSTRKGAGKKGKFNVSVGIFVPKPHTPFQWCDQIAPGAARSVLEGLRRRLKMPGVQMKWQNPETSLVEGVCSRGDRRLSRLLVAAFKKGCRFDGWSDHFDITKWQEAMAEEGIDPNALIFRERAIEEPLPWDVVDIGVTSSYLASEWHRAKEAVSTEDCRTGQCHQCGVCDFVTIAPRITGDSDTPVTISAVSRPGGTPENFKPMRITYEKTGSARYFGHLELISIMTRALRRTGIPIRYTEGYHPKPKMAFNDPLPVGIESKDEQMLVWVGIDGDLDRIEDAMNRQLPDGLAVVDVTKAQRLLTPVAVRYRIVAPSAVFDPMAIARFNASAAWPFTKTGRAGKEKALDLKTRVGTMLSDSDRELVLTLHTPAGMAVRPGDVLYSVFNMGDAEIQTVRIMKEKSFFADKG
ncbi:MAG: TIGR03960 family B12-binding radical SAM protein [Pseudomonadota bacterium]